MDNWIVDRSESCLSKNMLTFVPDYSPMNCLKFLDFIRTPRNSKPGLDAGLQGNVGRLQHQEVRHVECRIFRHWKNK